MGRKRRLSAGILAIAAAMSFAACGDNDDAGAPTLADPSVTGRELSTEFLTILQDADLDALDRFLADGFQLQRTDGTGATKAEYLQNPAQVNDFVVGETVIGVQDDDVLTVRWTVTVDSVINGQPTGKAEAPRISTYVWDEGRWRLVSHANFNAIP